MSSLLGVMFRNGTLYFIVLLVLNILHIVFIFLPNSILHVPLTNSSYVVWILEPLTAILVSHFMLDLHETHRALADQHGSDLSTIQIMSLDVGDPKFEESIDWSVASNPNLSHVDSGEGLVGPREVPSSPITRPYGSMEHV